MGFLCFGEAKQDADRPGVGSRREFRHLMLQEQSKILVDSAEGARREVPQLMQVRLEIFMCRMQLHVLLPSYSLV